jgi:hypothetical protein
MSMQYGHYSDSNIPILDYKDEFVDYKTNSVGYRCPEWAPLPVGKKNVVILGCSHTFGVGLEETEVWVDQLYSRVDQTRLRFWNLGSPGASGDKIVRILYGTEKILFPKLIIVCWPLWSRRERLANKVENLVSNDSRLKFENEETDLNNFLKNVFFVEKFAEKIDAKTFHCFADFNIHSMPTVNVFDKTSLKHCWPEWSKLTFETEKRIPIDWPSRAKDGVHYGAEHHKKFAELFYDYFKSKLK